MLRERRLVEDGRVDGRRSPSRGRNGGEENKDTGAGTCTTDPFPGTCTLAEVDCDDPEDCPSGSICCAVYKDDKFKWANCQAPSACVQTFTDNVELWCTSNWPSGKSCTGTAAIGPYKKCQ